MERSFGLTLRAPKAGWRTCAAAGRGSIRRRRSCRSPRSSGGSGRLREAIEALESGLRAYPRHTSAQVALGRCRLEAGDVAGAVAALEKIVQQDPTHLVASKLLVEAYLRSGAARGGAPAARRLRRAQRARPRDRRACGSAWRPPAAAPAGEVFRLPRAAVPPPDLSALAATAADSPAGDGARAARGEPFRGLGGARARRRYLEGLGLGGIFRLLPAPRRAASARARASRATSCRGAAARPAPPAAAVEPAPTVTLGELYLRPGPRRRGRGDLPGGAGRGAGELARPARSRSRRGRRRRPDRRPAGRRARCAPCAPTSSACGGERSMFLERLSQVSSRIEGARALTLVGEDGIPVESVSSSPDLDLDLLAAELVAAAARASRTTTASSRSAKCSSSRSPPSATRSSSAPWPRATISLLVLGERGVYGRARFELRRARLLFEKDLD